MNPAITHVLQFFNCDHLPEKLAKVATPFRDLAHVCAERAPNSPETTVCLRKLLEAKDAAVRSVF